MPSAVLLLSNVYRRKDKAAWVVAYKKRIYRAAVSQRLRNTAIEFFNTIGCSHYNVY